MLSKILKKILLLRLNQVENISPKIIPEQFGFRREYSTTEQLIRITNDIKTGFNKNQATALVQIDIEKAFDTVWHDGLIYKLHIYGIPLYLIKIIKNYLTKRSFKVKVGETVSKSKQVVAGVPQGSILGPTLFLYFINDLPKTTRTKLALFADDTTIYSTSLSPDLATRNVQFHLSIVEKFFDIWKIKPNTEKTETILFNKKRRKPKTNIHFYDKEISWSNNVKYLGIKLDEKLTYTEHTKFTTRKTQAMIGILYPLLNKYSVLQNKYKLILYKSLIKPIMTYASPVWSGTYKTNIKKLQTIQNKCLRMALNKTPRQIKITDLHKETGVAMVGKYLLDIATKTYNLIRHKPNMSHIQLYDKETAPFKNKYLMPNYMDYK